jgi:hypothetical protein
MAIGDGVGDGAGDWEVFQFARAELVGPGIWEISRRLRGQAGTEAIMPVSRPAGSRVVLLDDGPVQMPLPASMVGLSRVYRFGPARRPPDDPSYREVERVFRGVGQRPYAPARPRVLRIDGGLGFSWIRRTRIDGDRWDRPDVPLGEVAERYLVQVLAEGALRREAEVSVPFWSYPDATRAADGVTGPYEVEIAQISDQFGPGLRARIRIDE